MRILPQIVRTIEIDLGEKQVLDILEKQFEDLNTNLDWQNEFEDEFFFQRYEKLFRIDAKVSNGRNAPLDLVCIGSFEKTDHGTLIILEYLIDSYGLEIFLKIFLGIAGTMLLFLLVAYVLSGFETKILYLMSPFIPITLILMVIRSGHENGIVDLHSIIYWTFVQQ